MSTILFDPYTGVGHVYSSLKLARLLREKGHHVIYTGNIKICQPAIDRGFGFVPHNPYFMPYDELKDKISGRKSIFENLARALDRSALRSAAEYVSEFRDIIKKTSPDLIVLDEENILKYFIYKDLNIPIVRYRTKPDRGRGVNFPPFNSFFCPKIGNPFSSIWVDILWFGQTLRNRCKVWIDAVLSFGQGSFCVYQKIIKSMGYRFKDEFSFTSSFLFAVKKGVVLNLSPISFDFPKAPRLGVFNVGPLRDYSISPNATSENPRFEILCRYIEKQKKINNRFVIYCSMGTVTATFKKKLFTFFSKMKKVAELKPDIMFIFSISENLDIESLLPYPSNVTIFTSVPQYILLEYCDIMVTHGGMNSIVECVFNEVPMLVYPLSTRWDQPGNSARVVFHKLGMRGKIYSDTPKAISRKIDKMKEDLLVYKNNLRSMKKKFEAKNESQEAVNVVESIIDSYHG